MAWFSLLLSFLEQQLIRITLGDVPKVIYSFIACLFTAFWTSPESERLRQFLGPIVVDVANSVFTFVVSYYAYDVFLIVEGWMRLAGKFAARRLMRQDLGISRMRFKPAEVDSAIKSFKARVNKKLESLKGKLENHPERDRLVELISDIQLQCAEKLNHQLVNYRDLYVRHIDTCLQILHDDADAFIREQPLATGLTDNLPDLTEKITTVKQELQQGVTPPASPLTGKFWPPFFPLIQLNIANAIPLHQQKLQCAAFTTWLGIIACLVWNIIAVTTAWISGEGGLVIWLLAILYCTVGVPGSYLLWCRPLYRILSSESPGTTMTYGWFFKYLIHIIFCIIAAIAPPMLTSMSLTGIYTTFDVSDNFWVANFYSVGFMLFIVEAMLSIWVIKQVYSQPGLCKPMRAPAV